MEKTEKFLLKLSRKNRQFLKHAILKRIIALDLDGMDIKPLKGHKGFYRARHKKIRVLFYKDLANGVGVLVEVNYRDKIYKNL
jgi:mRNA-degrading endonuclease RelE of RelBE toxin-antitoxin system